MRLNAAWLLLALLPLGGCATAPQGSIAGGECKFLERPVYAVRGARQYDQDWIDSTIEGGVGACGWRRPAPRPAELDAPVPVPRAKPVVKRKKPLWLRMLHGLHKKKPAPVPVTPIADPLPAETPEPVAAPAPPPPPAPPPCSPIDKLLSPGACP